MYIKIIFLKLLLLIISLPQFFKIRLKTNFREFHFLFIVASLYQKKKYLKKNKYKICIRDENYCLKLLEINSGCQASGSKIPKRRKLQWKDADVHLSLLFLWHLQTCQQHGPIDQVKMEGQSFLKLHTTMETKNYTSVVLINNNLELKH